MVRWSSWNRTSNFVRKYKKFPHSPFKSKWRENLKQKDAMEDLRRGLAADLGNPVHQQGNSSKTRFLSCLISTFRLHNCDPTPQAYSFVIKTLAKTSQLENIASVLDHLENSEKFETPESILVDVIRVYGISSRIPEAIDVFGRIPNFRCVPSAYSLNALLSVLVRKRRGLEMILGILSKAKSMRIRLEESTTWILIRALCRIGEVDSAMELLRCMTDDGFSVDSRSCSFLLRSLCKHKDSSCFAVTEFLEDLRKTGFCPCLRDYANVMRFLVDGGRGRGALRVLNQMKCERIEPDIVCYTIALQGVIADGDYPRAEELFDELLLLGLVPDVYTYNVYVNGLCKQNNIKGAIRLVSGMEELGCNPNVITYNILLKALVKARDLSRAKTLWKEMELKGIGQNEHTYELMIDGFIALDEVLQACNFLEEAFDKNLCLRSSRINQVICRLCGKSLIDKAVEFLVNLADKGVSPELNAWENILHSCGSNLNVAEGKFIGLMNS